MRFPVPDNKTGCLVGVVQVVLQNLSTAFPLRGLLFSAEGSGADLPAHAPGLVRRGVLPTVRCIARNGEGGPARQAEMVSQTFRKTKE